MDNLVIDSDSYKFSHWLQYPKGTTRMISYLESRVGSKYQNTVFFGLQYILKEYLTKTVTMEMIEEAKEFATLHMVPFNYEGWKYIVEELKGKLPIRIRAVPEGTIVPIDNVLMTVESTDPKVFWVVSWFETILMRIWYPITVATQSWHCKEIIKSYLDKTSEDTAAEIGFKLHDFGSRGVSSRESAMIGGAAHLVNFLGSDTCAGIWCANKYYNEKMAGFSIPAAEHSTMTAYGKDGEEEAYRNMLKQYAKPGAIVAVVSDSWDIYNAITNIWGKKLKQEVIDSGATIVIRPDSGNPPEVVLKCLELLEEAYGVSYNTKGYKVLNHVRVIQGDGINIDMLRIILETITSAGYSATNVAFGMGGGLLQQLDRDTQRFAFKCCLMTIDGKDVDIFKEPVTDSMKRSKSGELDLVYNHGKFETVKGTRVIGSIMKDVFLNGKILRETNLTTVRDRVNGKLTPID